MKQKLSIFLILVLLLSVTSINVLAASSRYSFDMKWRVVDGKDNKEFHKLDSGNAYIDGSHRIYHSEYPQARKENLHYTLIKNNWGFDKGIGTIEVKPNTSFSRNFGKIDSGEYYLQVWKTNNDYHHTKGSGTLSN